MRTSVLLLCVLKLATSGCERPTSGPDQVGSSQPPPPQITELPVSLTVKQRSTKEIPGSDGRLSITVDDISRGQVLVSLVSAAGNPVLGPVSMTTDDTRDFEFGERLYSMALTKLDNELIGDDFASFEISEANAPMSERTKIERLIDVVEKKVDAVFIRNGIEHSSTEAAIHLRAKLKAMGQQSDSATAFIDNVASRSSATGKTYEIRFADGRTSALRDYLLEELSKIQQPPTTR